MKRIRKKVYEEKRSRRRLTLKEFCFEKRKFASSKRVIGLLATIKEMNVAGLLASKTFLVRRGYLK